MHSVLRRAAALRQRQGRRKPGGWGAVASCYRRVRYRSPWTLGLELELGWLRCCRDKDKEAFSSIMWTATNREILRTVRVVRDGGQLEPSFAKYQSELSQRCSVFWDVVVIVCALLRFK